MNAKEILGAYQKSRKLWAHLIREEEELRAMLTAISIDYSREKVQATPNGDRWAEILDRLIRIEEQHADLVGRAVEEMEQTQTLINRVEDPTLRELLWRRWIKGQTMEQISEEMARDLRWIYRLHARALEQIDHVLTIKD